MVPPLVVKAGLKIDKELESGESERIIEVGQWKTFFDSRINWVCIGDIHAHNQCLGVEFADGIIAVITNDGLLRSIWLNPDFQ